MEKSPKVFVVDQDPDQRFQLQQLIRQTGFAVGGQAGLGTEAVTQATEAQPDIILCGLREPVVRAEQTIESLAQALPETPVIVYATSSDLELVRRAMLAGARDFLPAPVKPEDLKRSLTAILEWEERRKLRETGSVVGGTHGAIITVFGAKGGVGKTTIAANLGVALAAYTAHSVVLVDADDTFGDTASTLSLTPERSITESLRTLDGLADGDGLKPFLTAHGSGLAVLTSPVSTFEWRGVTGERMEQLLRRLARQFDIVLVDTAGTLSDVSQAALEAASLILWITTPEYTSVRDSLQALGAIRTLRVPEDRIRVILNTTYPEVEVTSASIEQALGLSIFWTIPYDRYMRRSAQAGKAVLEAHPQSPGAQNLKELALTLTGAAPRRSRNGGVLRRMLPGRGGQTREEARR